VSLRCSTGESLSVDAVLVAAGRKSNTEKLNLAAAGVAVGERGLIRVDEHFRTNVPHIYAAGDVIGSPKLASASMEQGRRAALHALGAVVPTRLSPLIPSGIYTIPEASMVGETEQALERSGVSYVVGRARYENDARGRIIGDTAGFLKLLFRRDDMKLLGVHVLGEQATEVVHIGLMAMLTGSTGDVFAAACFNFPTLAGLYKTATFDARLQNSRSATAVMEPSRVESRTR
jgi:NAD(P) transhydrogenase